MGFLASIHAVVFDGLRTPRRASRQYWVDASTTANVLRLVRGCPKLTDLIWYAKGLTPLADDDNEQNVDNLSELLETRGAQSSEEETYFELDVFPEYGPWKRDSHHYRNTRMSQHPSGPVY